MSLREHNWREKAIRIADRSPDRSWRSIARELRVPYSSMTDHLRKHFKGYIRPSELKGRDSMPDGSKALQSPKKGFKTDFKDFPKILFIDIETSPIISGVWGLFKNNVGLNQIHKDWHIISYAAKWAHKDEIYYKDQRGVPDIEDDVGLLEDIWALLDEADFVVAHNGIKFDTRKINARLILNGFDKPSQYKVIDTLSIAKKEFGFTSNRLEYLTDNLCTQHKKLKHEKFSGYELWKECLKDNLDGWEEMEAYNKVDVLSLEELFYILAPWSRSLPNFDLYFEEPTDLDEWEFTGYYYTGVSKFKKYRHKVTGVQRRSRVNEFTKEKRASILMNML